MKRLLTWVFVKPFHHAFYLTRSVSSNFVNLFRAGARGVSRNIHKHAPLSPGMSHGEIRQMDRWWRSLGAEERSGLYEQHKDWILSHQIYAELSIRVDHSDVSPPYQKPLRPSHGGGIAQNLVNLFQSLRAYLSIKIHGFRTSRKIWSLTVSTDNRAKALPGQRGMYRLWSAIWISGISISVLAHITGNPSPLYYLMFTAFFVFVSSDLLSSRVTLAQVLYGRRVSLWELLVPLPKELIRHPEREERYDRLYKQVAESGVTVVSPVRKEFRKKVWNWSEKEASQ